MWFTLRKAVLIIAYLFPPIGGVAVQRPLKFVRYLRDYGWDPIVLTGDGRFHPTMDPSLLKEVPDDVPIIRVSDPLSRLVVRTAAATAASSRPAQNRPGRSRDFNTAVKRQVRALLKAAKNSLLIPDENVLWALRAAVVGSRVVREHGVHCVYSTSGPNSAHIAGLLIHRWTGIKWIADFRDPWTDNFHFDRTGLGRDLEVWLERRVFDEADGIMTVTDSFKRLFDNKYPERQSRIRVVRNGIDPNDFPRIPETAACRTNGPFTFLYSGILYPKRSPASFLRALAKVLERGTLARTDVRVEFAGVFDYPGQTANQELVRELGLEDVVRVLGYMPREQVLQRMYDADALLLIGEKVPGAGMYVPGKLYEYLYVGRPILALVEEGEAASLVRQSEAGEVVDPEDENAIAEAIVRMVHTARTGASGAPKRAEATKYTRQAQTEQLARWLDELTSEA